MELFRLKIANIKKKIISNMLSKDKMFEIVFFVLLWYFFVSKVMPDSQAFVHFDTSMMVDTKIEEQLGLFG